MRIAICNETFQDWPFEKALSYAAGLGYEGIEVAPFTMGEDARKISRPDRLRLVELAGSNGLEMVGLHWLFARTEGFHLTNPDPQVVSKTADYFRALIDLCFDLGGRIMVLGSPQQRRLLEGVDRSTGLHTLADILITLLPTLEAAGIRVAIEPLGPEECNFLQTAREARELINLVSSPQVQLHLDVKAMSTEKQSIPNLIEENASQLVHFHANDPNRRGPGMGAVDFQPIVVKLQEVGYAGWLSVEVFDYSPGVEALAGQSIANLRQCLAALSS